MFMCLRKSFVTIKIEQKLITYLHPPVRIDLKAPAISMPSVSHRNATIKIPIKNNFIFGIFNKIPHSMVHRKFAVILKTSNVVL